MGDYDDWLPKDGVEPFFGLDRSKALDPNWVMRPGLIERSWWQRVKDKFARAYWAFKEY
jgi:hypothetical protein